MSRELVMTIALLALAPLPSASGDWIKNSPTVARYVNGDAPTGGAVKVAVIKPGQLLRMTAKSLGDVPLDVSSPPTGPVDVVVSLTTFEGTIRMCGSFATCQYAVPTAGVHILTCRDGSSGGASCQPGDIPIMPTLLKVVDKIASSNKAKVVFVSKDPAITKGTSTDASGIIATMTPTYNGMSAEFTMPQTAPTCFQDPGDGTLLDTCTNLQWEKKTTANVDDGYSWSITGGAPDGTAFTAFLAGLNTPPCFAGHCDWRMPRSGVGPGQALEDPAELLSILDLSRGQCGGGTGPCIDFRFGPTATSPYWSGTPSGLEVAFFNFTGIHNQYPGVGNRVRAVRGGGCGDGIATAPVEECDLGAQNGVAGSGCSAHCRNASCGNSIPEDGEGCDLGAANGAPGSGCTAACDRAFVDNGLTVLDPISGLEWEKKGTLVGSGPNAADAQDVDNRYTWHGQCTIAYTKRCQPDGAAETACKQQTPSSDWVDAGCEQCTGGDGTCAFALPGTISTVWSWLAQVNASSFAGHNDWRLPTSGGARTGGPSYTPAELESIVNTSRGQCLGGDDGCIDSVFGPTAASFYWSASLHVAGVSYVYAWGVFFGDGGVYPGLGHTSGAARAVRGGCGDGQTQTPPEECDLGAQNGVPGSGCSAHCRNATCGNGSREDGEACDAGAANGMPGSGCSLSCTTVFTDNGTTVIDPNTGLEWEKKSTLPGSGENAADLHDVDNGYAWYGQCSDRLTKYCQPNATAEALCKAQTSPETWATGCEQCTAAEGSCVVLVGGVDATVWDWLAQLNAANFGGHADWRLPTVAGVVGQPQYEAAELESIFDPTAGECGGGSGACIDATFGPTTSVYWSSTSWIDQPISAGAGIFYSYSSVIGPVNALIKLNALGVRAVRTTP